MREAEIVTIDKGKQAHGPGWFVMNLRDVAWQTTERGGTWSQLESQTAPFGQFGIGVHVLPPGESSGFYHWESDQEGFLVLAGECIAIVEGQERRMGAWDYLHCPPGTAHITIGAAGGPCALITVGSRSPHASIRYLVDEAAARHGMAVSAPTGDPRVAYRDRPPIVPAPGPAWPPAP
jgi:quercetin dioxygenase-like cupin family protein